MPSFGAAIRASPDLLWRDRAPGREELLANLALGRAKRRAASAGLTAETAQASAVELMLHHLRHVQNHAARSNMLLRPHFGAALR